MRVEVIKVVLGTQLVGRLFSGQGRILFEYDPVFLKSGLEISPFKLPLQVGVQQAPASPFDGLFGVFADSLPDGWGRLLIDRKVAQLGYATQALTPLDRLSFVGSHGMGALKYEPEGTWPHDLIHSINLDELAGQCEMILGDDESVNLDDLLILNGSSGGARPKINVVLSATGLSKESQEGSGDHWLIKFRSSSDLRDIGAIEYAYHLMAIASGINVPAARLFPSETCEGYFGVRRFDRIEGRRVHMHTLSGLLHADYRYPSLDYGSILKATMILTKNPQQLEEQYRRCVFNVLTHNRDDHAKNFSFLMDSRGVWSLSPAYDLTFSYGPAGEHCAHIAGEGRAPTVTHLLRLASQVGVALTRAQEIIQQIKEVVACWPQYAKRAGVSGHSTGSIHARLLALN